MGRYLASVGDDKLLQLWELEQTDENGIEIASARMVRLTSQGVSVRWHQNRAGLAMVGERCGAIRLYDVNTGSWIFSVYEPGSKWLDGALNPTDLTCVDWNPADPKV
ncbi:Nucleoporin Nup37 [Quaeritorhiza haematococci]|nr:Nucleoporin Nup37 [Quaeritorhiza haematococci]